MHFKIIFTDESECHLEELKKPHHARRLKAVLRALGLMESNLKHPSLNTHKYTSGKWPRNEEVFESYVENNTPGAYRIFWVYGPGKGVITIVAITPHP
jgi:hypothetical protein